MFQPVIDILQNLAPELKLLVSAIVAILGVVFVIKPVAQAFKAFSDSKWMQGLMWVIAAVVIVALSFGIIGIIYGVGEEQGTTMEEELSYQYQPENVERI
ncbi:hypothetical protein M4L90_12435 [Staphylococcus equorum]|uniref:Uncharacterized protein n=1 Tax=Staphylococcus equorum TaxID=246432 RepID=A0A9X4L670_9STAP|nr:hypothetical protein [Staphylococcus equorum]MDG0820728.1 hypothetical protein [Staphylococcus equorum]MDG0841353.1 hypothetical protein [Staphylococcus equorum]MDG0847053.1 hypothetical protein [Staphylococcus equorum]PTE82329.1 hypothetical protein BUY85_00905 [Staphylococcus equorum]